MHGVSELGGMGLPSRVDGRGANPVEYVLFRIYEALTARGESERSGDSTGATRPASPAHI